MERNVRTVIVGGGISGLSALYHLCQEGWTDTVLLERNTLASGTTWHSAAQCPALAFNQLPLLLRKYTIELYKELADDPDHPINYHHAVGGMRLLTSPDQVDACHHIISVARGLGIDFQLIGPDEVVRRNPLIEKRGILAALWDGLDGDIDPAQLCQSLARRSRKAGSRIYQNTPVTGIRQKSNREWVVRTDQGDIDCEHLVVAAGYRVQEVGEMLGVTYPVVSMEHMYFITEPVPQLVDRECRVPMVRCPRDTFYMRQERQGILVGVYEHDCRTFGMNGIDPGFANALCPDDLDRCLPRLEAIFQRVPCLKRIGIQSVVNGPIAYSADAGPLVGRHPGRHNLWSMNGIRVGIGEGGGYGKMLAQMIVHGEAQWDTWQIDPRRITDYASRQYTALKAIEDYRNEFRWHMPHEHRPVGRPARVTSLYPVLKSRGAEFGAVNGWERAMFFRHDPAFVPSHSYRFANWHGLVRSEVEAVASGVGIAELSGFNQLELRGSGVRDWLDSLTCSNLPTAAGKVGLAYFLTGKGNVSGEATIVQTEENRFLYGSAATAEYHDRDWLAEQVPAASDIEIYSLTHSRTVLLLAGPKTRALLACVSTDDWSQEGFPWMTARYCGIGQVEVFALSVSFSGEQAFELHIPNALLFTVYQCLVEAGEAFGLAHFGMHAIESMRMEKGYGHWKQDFITEYNPFEAGLSRFVNLHKSFPGKPGLVSQVESGSRRIRVMLVIESADAPAQSGETVFAGDRPVGTITSAAWGYRIDRNLAMAYVEPQYAAADTALKVMLVGRWTDATVCRLCMHDPGNRIPRGLA